MKRLIYIAIVSLLTAACANNAKEATMSDAEYSETEVLGNNDMKLEETGEFGSAQMAEAKLNDYFELLLLRQKHPEFSEDISAQIKNLSEADLQLPDSIAILSIENIRQAGEVMKLSDSLQKITFHFDLITENGSQPDSITAVIRSQKVSMEQQEVTATKVTFEKE